jgi:partner of Y14 and mago protein
MASVEKTTYGETYIKQEDGSKIIPESQRADGSVRKPIRVKEGYTPPAETRYDPPSKPARGAAAYPPGYSAPDEAPAQLGDPNRRIPGFTPDTEETKPKSKTRSRNKKGGGDKAEKEEATADAPVKAEAAPKTEAAAETEPKAEVSPEQATEKLIRKAKKKLTEIEALEKRGAPYEPAEQEKLSKKAEFVAELKYLDKVLKGQAVAAPLLAKAKATPTPAKATPAPQAAAAKTVEKKAAPAPAAAKPVDKKAAPAPAAPAPAASPQEVEAAQKRLRNVNKKLREIQDLLSSGKKLDADQQQKVDRKTDLEIEFKHLSAAVA